jgi:hypothetical protein
MPAGSLDTKISVPSGKYRGAQCAGGFGLSQGSRGSGGLALTALVISSAMPIVAVKSSNRLVIAVRFIFV